jgi:hypothetical protein
VTTFRLTLARRLISWGLELVRVGWTWEDRLRGTDRLPNPESLIPNPPVWAPSPDDLELARLIECSGGELGIYAVRGAHLVGGRRRAACYWLPGAPS